MANNDVAVAPRLQKVPGKKDHRKARRKAGERGLRLGRPSYPVAGLTLLAVLLIVASGYLGWSLHNDSEATAERASVLTAAQQEAAALTTLSSETGSKDYDAVLAGSAGDLKEQ